MAKPLLKRCTWFSEAEFVAEFGGDLVADLKRLQGKPWKLAGRPELREFTDGSGQVRIPLRRDNFRFVRTFDIPASEKGSK